MYRYCFENYDWKRKVHNAFRGEKYKCFLDLAFERADSFTLLNSVLSWHSNDGLEKALERFKIREYVVPEWYVYKYERTVNEYVASDETKTILLDHGIDLFFSREIGAEILESDYTLEDICFFKKDIAFVCSVTHENDAVVYGEDEAFDDILTKEEHWEKENDPKCAFSLKIHENLRYKGK